MTCPFCGAPAEVARLSSGQPFRRMAAAASVAAGVTAVVACSLGSSTAFYGSPGPIETSDSGQSRSGGSVSDGSAADSPSVIAFYGNGMPVSTVDGSNGGVVDGGHGVATDGSSGGQPEASTTDASSAGTDASESDAPSVVAFYGTVGVMTTDSG